MHPGGQNHLVMGGSGRVITWLGIHVEKLHLLVWQHGFIQIKKRLIVASNLADLAVAAVVAVASSDKTLWSAD